MKIVIAGGSGYLGRFVARHYLGKNWTVVTLARQDFPGREEKEGFAPWDGKTLGPWTEELEGADILLNLAGRSVNCRYNRRNRNEMKDSRVESTRILADAVFRARRPPVLWLNSSTATIYAHSEGRDQAESTGTLGKGLSVEIARAWEEEFFLRPLSHTRRVALRSAMVFGPGGDGVYGTFAALAKRGLAGTQGQGTQYLSWIHVEDFLAALDWIHDRQEFCGPVNISAPEPLQNHLFLSELRRSLKVRIALPAPEWILELGAIFMRTETELLLKSRRVVPERLLASGFRFRHPKLQGALTDLARRVT